MGESNAYFYLIQSISVALQRVGGGGGGSVVRGIPLYFLFKSVFGIIIIIIIIINPTDKTPSGMLLRHLITSNLLR